MRIHWAALVVCLVTAEPTAGQIYSWRDESGHLVLSDKPKEGEGGERQRSEYDDLIEVHARQHGLSPDLIRAVIQAESGFNPRAVSARGAMGLMQLTPVTARVLGVRDPFEPAANIRGGVSYLAELMMRYNQNVELALAAYNAGPNSVERYGAIPPYRETQDYVRKVTSALKTSAVSARPDIYKWVEWIEGRPITRYSNIPPSAGNYTIVSSRTQPAQAPCTLHQSAEYVMIECSKPSK